MQVVSLFGQRLVHLNTLPCRIESVRILQPSGQDLKDRLEKWPEEPRGNDHIENGEVGLKILEIEGEGGGLFRHDYCDVVMMPE